MDKREWRVKIGVDVHWLTTAEKDFYLSSISQGIDLVKLRNGNLYLSKNPQEIVHISILEDNKKLSTRKWQCRKGKWHEKDSKCVCGVDFTPVRDEKGNIVSYAELSDEPTN